MESRTCARPRRSSHSRCDEVSGACCPVRMMAAIRSRESHPLLPLIPDPGRPEPVDRWLGLGRHRFGRAQFPCFWPPELGVLGGGDPMPRQRRHQYVILDSEHVHPRTPMRWEELRYRPHLAQFGAEQIVVRDRDVSNARESPIQGQWFLCAAHTRTCTATSRCSSHGDRRRQRRMVPHHHVAATSEPPSTPSSSTRHAPIRPARCGRLGRNELHLLLGSGVGAPLPRAPRAAACQLA